MPHTNCSKHSTQLMCKKCCKYKEDCIRTSNCDTKIKDIRKYMKNKTAAHRRRDAIVVKVKL